MNSLFAAASAAFALCISSLACAEETPASDAAVVVAEQYLAAYETFEPAKMAPFLHKDAVFSDPTSTNQTADGGPFEFDGKEAVLKGLGDYAAQYKRFTLNYDVERRYESNGVVVFVAQLSYEGETKDAQTFSGAEPIVTVITVKDGKVIRHTDFFDYKSNAVEANEN